jgi:hypothetical protein
MQRTPAIRPGRRPFSAREANGASSRVFRVAKPPSQSHSFPFCILSSRPQTGPVLPFEMPALKNDPRILSMNLCQGKGRCDGCTGHGKPAAGAAAAPRGTAAAACPRTIEPRPAARNGAGTRPPGGDETPGRRRRPGTRGERIRFSHSDITAASDETGPAAREELRQLQISCRSGGSQHHEESWTAQHRSPRRAALH